jgi:hypothetical protein
MEFCHLVLDLVVALVCEHSYYVSTLLHVTLGGDYRGGNGKTLFPQLVQPRRLWRKRLNVHKSRFKEHTVMAKSVKHYLPSGKEYKGAVHKMNGQVHTGAKHSPSSKVLKHTKPKKK